VTQYKHTPKAELLAQLAAVQEELERVKVAAEEDRTRWRRQNVLRFPFEEEGAAGAPARKKKRTLVNGAEFLSVEGFLAKAREAEENKARKDAEKKAVSREKKEAGKAARQQKKEQQQLAKASKSRAGKATVPVRRPRGLDIDAGAPLSASPLRSTGSHAVDDAAHFSPIDFS
jgi:hypothetical protein